MAAGPVAPVSSGVFPHGEHRAIQCGTCHETVPNHTTHQTVECTACHGTPEDYGSLPVRSDEDCMACHHDPERGRACSVCHGGELPSELGVATPLDLSRATAETTRTLAFAHDRHQQTECTTCHTEGIRFQVGRTCASCHAEHDEPGAECLTCHQPGLEQHEVRAHLGCGGSGCHDAPAVDRLPETRNVCLSCHADQREHEPGRECVACHATGRSVGAPVGGAGGAR